MTADLGHGREIYTGNSRGAVGDFIKQLVPDAFWTHKEPLNNVKLSSGERLTASHGKDGTVTFTIHDARGNELLHASGRPEAGQGLNEFRMYGKSVPHTDANAQIGQVAAATTKQGIGVNDTVDRMAGQHGYSNGDDFRRKAAADGLRDDLGRMNDNHPYARPKRVAVLVRLVHWYHSFVQVTNCKKHEVSLPPPRRVA